MRARALTHLSRRLLAGAVVRIVCGLHFREALHAGGVDLGQALFWLAFGLDLAIPQDAFQGYELPFA